MEIDTHKVMGGSIVRYTTKYETVSAFKTSGNFE